LKLQLDFNGARNVFTAHGDGFVELNKTSRYERGVIVMADRIIENWGSGGVSGLAADDIAQLAALAPGIVLLGTGRRQRFPSPALLRPLIEAQIGYEVMDVSAACRTYNLLTGEGREVAAALLFDRP
jgi:uncharacterized protein